MPDHRTPPEPTTGDPATDVAARLAAIEDALADLVTITDERLANIEKALGSDPEGLSLFKVIDLETGHLTDAVVEEGDRGVNQTVAAANTLIDKYLYPMRTDLDALLGIAVRKPYHLGYEAPGTPTKARPSTPAERLDAVAETVCNAATADVERQLRSAVGALRWDLKDGHLIADDVADRLLDAATARDRMPEPEARDLVRRLIASTKRKGRR